MDTKLLDRIRECPTLPTLPAVAVRVLELTRNPQVNLSQVAKVISHDPALATKLVRTVNSSFYGLSQSVSSIDRALVIMGLQSVKTLVLGFSLVSGLHKSKPTGFDHTTYWRRSLYAATSARIIAEKVGSLDADTCFLAALLMDIGMLALDQVLGDDYATICGKAKSHVDLEALEKGVLGITHADVGEMLAKEWKFPEELCVAMGAHHRPDEVEQLHLRTTCEAVYLSARCADVFVEKSPMWSIADVRRICMEKHHIGQLDCDSMMCEIGLRTKELAPLFEVKLDEASAAFEQVLQRANDELLEMTKVAQAEPAGDRRRAPRIPRDRSVTIMTCVNGQLGQVLTTHMRDVSARGMGLLHPDEIPVGSQFIFRVPRRDAAPSMLLYAVVRCEPTPGGRYVIGCELQCVLRDDDARLPSAAAV
jgi:HD-like signal output (HDOD) protein